MRLVSGVRCESAKMHSECGAHRQQPGTRGGLKITPKRCSRNGSQTPCCATLVVCCFQWQRLRSGGD